MTWFRVEYDANCRCTFGPHFSVAFVTSVTLVFEFSSSIVFDIFWVCSVISIYLWQRQYDVSQISESDEL